MIIENSDGTKTFLEEAGNPANEAVLFLHGIGADHRMWEPQINVFANSEYYVLAPDLLGHGNSSRVETLELLDWENQIRDLLTFKGISTCILAGVSMGGVIAQSYSIRNPDSIHKLVLSDTFGELRTVKEKLLGFSQVIGFNIYKVLGRRLLARGMELAYKAPYAENARKYFSEVSLYVDLDQMVLARIAINEIDAIGKIDGRVIPTLVLVGKEFGESFIEINRKIADKIEGSRFVVLEESMDPSNLVNPAGFNKKVLEFLGSGTSPVPD